MPKMFVLYRLKDDVTFEEFEAWVREIDYPSMRGLPQVRSLTTHRTTANFFDGSRPDYDYVEAYEIDDVEGFRREIADPEVQQVLGHFLGFVETPKVIVADAI